MLAGDPTDAALIQRCELHRATRALIACDAEADTLVIAVAIHSIAPELEVFALTQSRAVARALSELGVTQTLAADELVGHTVAKSLETPQAGSLLLQLIDNANYRLVETPVEARRSSHSRCQRRARRLTRSCSGSPAAQTSTLASPTTPCSGPTIT